MPADRSGAALDLWFFGDLLAALSIPGSSLKFYAARSALFFPRGFVNPVCGLVFCGGFCQNFLWICCNS